MKRMILMSTGGVLLIAALLLTTFNIYDDRRAEKEARRVVEAIFENPEEEKKENSIENTEMIYSEMEMPVVEFEGNRYIGLLEIPALELKLPVMEDWSYEKLRIAPCRYSGSIYQDDMIIAGHNYKAHFSNVKRLPIGEKLKYTDAAGNVFSYYIGWMETISGKDREKMLEGDWDLTLFTCTYGGQNRCAIRCIRENNNY